MAKSSKGFAVTMVSREVGHCFSSIDFFYDVSQRNVFVNQLLCHDI